MTVRAHPRPRLLRQRPEPADGPGPLTEKGEEMEAIWLLVGLVLGVFAGVGAMLFAARLRRAGAESAEVARLRALLEAAESRAGAREQLLALATQGAGTELTQRGGELVELMTTHLDSR